MDEQKLVNAQQLEKKLLWAEAAKEYSLLLKEETSNYLYERAAWCFSRAENYATSIIYLEKLKEIEPQSAKWPYMIGYQYYCQKNWIEAIRWFEKSLEIYPDYFVVKYRIAYAYNQIAGDFKKLTRAEYWRALSHLKDCHRLWAKFSQDKKQKEKSVYFDINFLNGKILMGLPNYREEAISLFLTALELKPDDEFARYNLAKTYYLNGEYEKARKYNPTGSQYYFIELSAYIDAKLGNYSAAIQTITRLTQRRKKDYLYNFLAEVYLLDNNPYEAYKAAQFSILQGPNNHKNFFILAKVYYYFGLLVKAKEYLDKAIKIKKEKYDAIFQECDTLREEIILKMPQNYRDDTSILAKLENLSSSKFSNGIICKYNTKKGFGFVRCNNKEFFFHISNCKYQNVLEGDLVEFSTVVSEKGIMAIGLQKTNTNI
jgi:tetratricopeptide (TPR) repeat protein